MPSSSANAAHDIRLLLRANRSQYHPPTGWPAAKLGQPTREQTNTAHASHPSSLCTVRFHSICRSALSRRPSDKKPLLPFMLNGQPRRRPLERTSLAAATAATPSGPARPQRCRRRLPPPGRAGRCKSRLRPAWHRDGGWLRGDWLTGSLPAGWLTAVKLGAGQTNGEPVSALTGRPAEVWLMTGQAWSLKLDGANGLLVIVQGRPLFPARLSVSAGCCRRGLRREVSWLDVNLVAALSPHRLLPLPASLLIERDRFPVGVHVGNGGAGGCTLPP